MSPEGDTKPRRPRGWRDRRTAPSEPARCFPGTWGAAGRWSAAKGVRPLLGKDQDGAAPDSEPLGSERGAPLPVSPPHCTRDPQPQTGPGPTLGEQPSRARRTSGERGCKPRATAGGHRCALRPASLCGGLGHRIEHGPAEHRAPDTGREAARSGRPKPGAGWRMVPGALRPFSESPRGLRGPRSSQPSQAARRSPRLVLGGCGRVGLGPGAGLGADPEAGLSLRQDPAPLPSVSVFPPPSSCSGRSPAWGGRRPAGQVR